MKIFYYIVLLGNLMVMTCLPLDITNKLSFIGVLIFGGFMYLGTILEEKL